MTATAAPQSETGTSVADKAEAILAHIVAAKGGSRRAGQVEMARNVATSLSERVPLLLQGGTGIGKALDVDTPIPTPSGFVRMGDLRVGDTVYDEQGQPTRVSEAFAVRHGRPCYKVVFSDGSVMVADGDHQWDVLASRSLPDSGDLWASGQTMTTAQIADALAGGEASFSVPLAAAVTGTHRDLPLDPYGLGLWLGGSSESGITAHVLTEHLPDALPGFSRSVRGRRTCITPTEVTEKALADNGVLGGTKHVPDDYLSAALAQREALLAGLLDASGFVVTPPRSAGQVQFTEVSHRLARDVQALACSLGYRATLRRREPGQTWIVAFSPDRAVFGSAVKNARFKTPSERPRTQTRGIDAVTAVKSRPVRCISVESSRHLYLAGREHVPTHNSIGEIAGALAFGQPVVIAPHTKALQDQLGADLDLVTSAFAETEGSPLSKTPTWAVVKGRSSYLCRNKIAPAAEPEDGQSTLVEVEPEDKRRNAATSDLGREVKALIEWADEADSGDRSEVPFPVSNRAWEQVSVTAEACTAKACPFYRDGSCFAEAARKKAKTADIIVTNQALLGQVMKLDMAIGRPLLMPDTVRGVIVDEAHEFPSVVANTFGAQVTMSRLTNAVKKTTALDEVGAPQAEKAREWANETITALERVVPVPKDPDRAAISKPEVVEGLGACQGAFEGLIALAEGLPEGDEDAKSRKDLLLRMLGNVVFDLRVLQIGTTDTQVAWVEPGMGRKAILRSAQFDVSERIHSRLLETIGSVVFTSATLTVAGKFDQPAKDYGFTLAPKWNSNVVESPFDYPQQGLLHFPDDMPLPSTNPQKNAAYAAAVAKVAAKMATAAGGRTLVLCTSLKAVELISAELERKVGRKFPVLIQRSGEPTKPLAEKFAADPKAILVGTRTFWSGVSIEGPTCSVVILDKSPFPSPGDPIIAARSEKADRNGGSGFREVSLPEAILTTVQGAGRLIRTVHDSGVVVLCDPRIRPGGPLSKAYSRDVLRSLPPFTREDDEAVVLDFLREIDRTADDSHAAVEVEEEDGSTDDTETKE